VSGRAKADLEPCGGPAAYRRHVRNREPVDQACREWHNADARRRYRTPPLLSGDRAEDYAWLRSCGVPPAESARRAGIRPAAAIARYESAYQATRTRRTAA